MGDMGDMFREHKEYMRDRKAKDGIDCPGCRKVQPKRIPSRLLPGWRCKVCGYVYHRNVHMPNISIREIEEQANKVISSHTIKDRNEHEAEHEACADMPYDCEDWSLMQEGFNT